MRIRESIGRRLKSRLGVATALAAVVMLAPLAVSAGGRAGGGGQPTRSGEDFEWRGHIATDKAIEVKGVNGGIVAEPTTGSEVEVVAHKKARKSDPEEVRIEVIEHPGGVTICALYPSPRGAPPNECKPGEGGRMNTHDNDVQVDFTVQVPAGVGFIGRNVNGDVMASGLKGDAEAYTVNGSIRLETRGNARASTVNGSIQAEMGVPAGDELEFESVNGGITVTMPAASGAEVHASTVNGDISTDFPITVTGKIGRRKLAGTIGSGGRLLEMKTVNGGIELKKAK